MRTREQYEEEVEVDGDEEEVVEEDGDEGGDGEAEGAMRRSDLTKSRTRASSESQFTGGGDCDGDGRSMAGEETAMAWGKEERVGLGSWDEVGGRSSAYVYV